VQVIPLLDVTTDVLGVKVSFTDVTYLNELQAQVETARRELETAYEELQSSNEELETTNEELQSTIEELETTNEELQSTNEELETMNEELQSTNEELETLNNEMAAQSDEASATNSLLSVILSSLPQAIVVIDAEMRVSLWNKRAEDLWGLKREEVTAHHFLDLSIGLPVQELRLAIRDCLGGGNGTEKVLRATNRRGRSIDCAVACLPMLDTTGISGVLLVMEEREPVQT
jgi:two-component system CheB/CheR fusion protein